LALPDEFFQSDPLRRQWDGRAVTVRGEAFAQPNPLVDGGYMTWYAVKDRKLSTGSCDDGLGIYVATMRSAAGKTWPPR